MREHAGLQALGVREQVRASAEATEVMLPSVLQVRILGQRVPHLRDLGLQEQQQWSDHYYCPR